MVGEKGKEENNSFSCYFLTAFSWLVYIVSQGNITATIVWLAIATGVSAGLSYYKEVDYIW